MCYRNLMRNKRRTINTFMMISIGLSFMVTITTLTNSISAGTYPGEKTVLGGDIALGNPYYNYAPNRMMMDHSFIGLIDKLPDITATCLYRFSVDLGTLSPGLGCVGNQIDRTGYQNQTSISIGIIDGSSYYQIDKDTFLKIDASINNIDAQTLFQGLDNENWIILQSSLKQFVNKNIGSMITLKMEGMSASLMIAGYAKILPGFPWTMNAPIDSSESILANAGSNTSNYCAVISWNTYNRLIGQFYNNIDLIVKNNSGSPRGYPIPSTDWGALDYPINRTTVLPLLQNYIANQTIANASFMINDLFGMDNLFPFPIYYQNSHPFDYNAIDPLQMSSSSFTSAWNPINASVIGVDPTGNYEYGDTKLVDVDPSVPACANGSVEKILDWYAQNTTLNACIVNEAYADKPSNPLGTISSDLDSVYNFHVGDAIQIKINETMTFNLTVVATVDSNLNYAYSTPSANVSSPLVLNPKTLDFNSDYNATTNSSPNLANLFNTYYAAANVIFLPRSTYLSFFNETLPAIEQLANWEIVPGIELDNLNIFNETLAYQNNMNDYSNLLYISVNNASQVQASLQRLFASTPETQNFSVFDPREAFFQITHFDEGNAFLGVQRNDLSTAIGEIAAFYKQSGKTYDETQVNLFGKSSSLDVLLQETIGMFTGVFTMITVLGLTISLLGLSISMFISVYQRRREFGTLLSVGYSRKTIFLLIYGECMALGLMGLLVGLISGLITASTLISQIPFIEVLPILFSPPVTSYLKYASGFFRFSSWQPSYQRSRR